MISIVMAYYNRLSQLRYTLKTFTESKEKDFEVIIVNDFSDADNQLTTIKNEFPGLNITVIEMQSLVREKNYCNPCVPYNVGFRASTGDKIIIQNPECCHIGDIISYVNENLNENDYITFHCWAADKTGTTLLQQGKTIEIGNEIGKARWYNHNTHRPVALHFTSAISRSNLIELNGFDESFSMGFNYDDNEFLQRIKNKGLNVKFIANPQAVHQYHRKSYGHPKNPQPTNDNSILFSQTVASKKIRANNLNAII